MYFIGISDQAGGKLESIWAQGLHIRLHKISVDFRIKTLAEELLHLLQPPCINRWNNFKEMYRQL